MSINATVLMRRFMTKVKFRHMEVLVRLCELGSMRRATEALGMTQPSISQMISEMEQLMETELFFRHARGVEPTAATLELLPVARRMLSSLGEAAEVVANRLGDNAGLVRVAASEAGLFCLVHPILPEFARQRRGVQVAVNLVHGGATLVAIAEGACDILCLREPNVVPEGWVFEACRPDALIVVCGPQHPLAKAGHVTQHSLGGYRWLMNRVDSIARRRYEEMHSAQGWPDELRCHVVTHIPEMTVRLLASDPYLALLPRAIATPYLAGGQIVELPCDIAFPLSPLGFLWEEAKATRTTKLFVQALRLGALAAAGDAGRQAAPQ